jgi:hypothetical protein
MSEPEEYDLEYTLLLCSRLEKERQLAVLQDPKTTVDVVIHMHVIPEGTTIVPGHLGKNFFRQNRASDAMTRAMVHDAIAVTITDLEALNRKITNYKRKRKRRK